LPKGADVDYCFPSSTAWLALEVFLTNQDTTRRFFQSKDSDYLKLLDTRISRTVSEGRPYFNFYYFTRPGHSPSRWSADTWADRNKTLEKFRQNYYKDVQKANNLLMDMVKMILDKDDSSLIIIMGDHGTWGYRYGRNGNNKLIPNRLFTLDRFGVLSAIRLPKGQNQRFDNNLKTHINIFRYVFAYLSGNDNILTARASDNSYEDAETLVIKDGTIDSTSSGYAKIVANHANKIMSQKNGNADQITVLIEMGLILGKHNHLKEAYHYFQKAIEFSKGKKKLRRQASSAHSGLGQIYYLGGEYELALSHFKEAYVQYDQNWQVCYNLDLTLKALKRFKEAEFYFNIYKKNSSKYK
jgi:tetratricopeptide (TPR) repeat protein